MSIFQSLHNETIVHHLTVLINYYLKICTILIAVDIFPSHFYQNPVLFFLHLPCEFHLFCVFGRCCLFVCFCFVFTISVNTGQVATVFLLLLCLQALLLMVLYSFGYRLCGYDNIICFFI